MNEQIADVGTEIAIRPARSWRTDYALRLAVTDLLVLVWVIFGVQIAWLGVDVDARGFSASRDEIEVGYTAISVVLLVAWLVVLSLYGTRGHRVVGAGAEEYKLIIDGALRLFGVVAIVAFLLKVDLARGYILLALPVGVVTLLFSRWMWRQWLAAKRTRGEYSSTVLLVGSEESAVTIAKELKRNSAFGLHVLGACLPQAASGDRLREADVPVVGSISSVLEALETTGADTVIITSSGELSSQGVRNLSWSLEPGRQHLVVAPGLTDIGGPRIHTRPVAGLPLMHVETPKYSGAKTFAKRGFDVAASLLLIVLVLPVLIGIAVLVKSTSTGPVFFAQQRIGLGGEPFQMLKFRSMVADAESRLQSLWRQERSLGNQVMFKMKDDPRVTPVGSFLRRFSLDELPQLFNVLAGQMSLVGPRPPLKHEVSVYEEHVHRRFLVKPGITGLWQVSGRSNLSWEDTVRLDLFYVENWSLAGDLLILWRTAKAVLARDGAY